MTLTVIIGYDGSDPSRNALAYAADRARNGQLFIVHATERVPSYLGRALAQQVLDASMARANDLELEISEQLPPETDFELEVLEGPPGEAIVTVARVREADEIVIGSRGLGSVRATLGSVSHDVVHLAECPVVVIPSHAAKPAYSG